MKSLARFLGPDFETHCLLLVEIPLGYRFIKDSQTAGKNSRYDRANLR